MANPSEQSVFDFAEIKTAFPGISELGAEDYAAKGRDIVRLFASVSPLNGILPPEGVATANLSKMYVDTAAQILYFNPVIGAKTGWVAL